MTKKQRQYWTAWSDGAIWGGLLALLVGMALSYGLFIPSPPQFTFDAPSVPSVWSASSNIATTSFNKFHTKAKGECSVVFTEIRSCEK